jgi:AAA family ATP:ADP antiporter
VAEVPVGAVGRFAETLCVIRTRPYLQWLGVLVFVAALTATVVDYIFKSTVAMMVAPEALAATLARFYLVLNSIALLVQVFGVGWLVRRAGVVRGLGLLPLLLVAGGMVQLFGPLLLSALLLKGLDGALRHSLHRTTLEILYVPLTTRVRALAKPMIDVLGQRGGQAVASLLLLAAINFGWGRMALGSAVVMLALLWIALVVKLEKPYVGLFRSTLQGLGSGAEFALPSLDLGSLEKLLAALNSTDDREVIAALDLLVEQGRAHVIPALILYHPAPAVVERALAIFTKAQRVDYLPLARRLLEHAEPRVRAAAIRALVQREVERELLERALHDISPAVRAAAWVGLVAVGALQGEAAERRREELVDPRHPEVAIALAGAIRAQPHARFEALLLQLAESRSTRVRSAVAQAMSAMPTPRFLPVLTSMLADRGSRPCARRTLVGMGDVALEHLARTLADRGVARRVRRHLPRTISRFEGSKAVAILMPYLVDEADDMVRFRVLRALGQIRSEEPEVKLDEGVLLRARDELLAAAFRLRAWSAALRRLRVEEEARPRAAEITAADEHALQQLLEDLLVEQQAQVLDRLFRVLSLLDPKEDFSRLQRGLHSRRGEIRSSSIELLHAILQPPVREAVLALVDGRPEEGLPAAAGRYFEPRHWDRDALLAELVQVPNETLRGLAAFYAQQVGRSDLAAVVAARAAGENAANAVASGSAETSAATPPPAPAASCSTQSSDPAAWIEPLPPSIAHPDAAAAPPAGDTPAGDTPSDNEDEEGSR